MKREIGKATQSGLGESITRGTLVELSIKFLALLFSRKQLRLTMLLSTFELDAVF